MAAQRLAKVHCTIQHQRKDTVGKRLEHHIVPIHVCHAGLHLPTAKPSPRSAQAGATLNNSRVAVGAQLIATHSAGPVIWQDGPARQTEVLLGPPSSPLHRQLADRVLTQPNSSPAHGSELPDISATRQPSAHLPLRTPQQQHLPPSPPSSSSSASPSPPSPSEAALGSRRHVRSRTLPAAFPPSAAQPPHATTSPRRHDALLSKVTEATNWYELRAVLLTNAAGPRGGFGGGFGGASASTDPKLLLAVLRRLATIARYDMLPPEAADFSAFLGRWLLQHTTGCLPLMGPGELSLCLHSLAKLCHGMPAPPSAWAAAWFAAAQPYLLQRVFQPKDIALSLWALSRMQLRLPPAAVQLLLAAAEPLLGRFNGQDVAMIALALSVLQTRYDNAMTSSPPLSYSHAVPTSPRLPSLMPSATWRQRFLARCMEVLPGCGSQALANMLHGVVRSGLRPPEGLVYGICTALYDKLPECTPQALANVLSALEEQQFVPDAAWLERFWLESGDRMEGHGLNWGPDFRSPGDRCADGVDDGGSSSGGCGCGGGNGRGGGAWQGRRGWCNLDDLTHLGSAAAQLALVPPRWWVVRLYSAMELRVGRARPRQLAQMLQAVAQLSRLTSTAAAAAGLGAAAPAGAGGTAAEGSDREHGGSSGFPRVSSDVAISETARTCEHDPDGRSTRLPDSGAPSVPAPWSAHSPAAAGMPPPGPPRSLITAWHRAAAAALPGFNAIDAAHSLWALATLRERPPQPWLQGLVVQCRGGLGSLPPAELALLLWSLAALRFRPTWSWLADALAASMPALHGMSGQDFAMLTAAAAALGARPSGAWSTATLAALRPRLGSLQTRALANTARALYRLRVQPEPEWLEALAGELVRRWQRLAAQAAGGSRGDGDGGRGELRSAVLLLWVMSKWLGPQRERMRRPGGVGGQRLLRLRRRLRGSTLQAAAGTGAAAPDAAPDAVVSSLGRRRRAVRPGNLVASFGGDVQAAAAFRRRIADMLLGPAMDASQPYLAAGAASALDAILMAAVMTSAHHSARQAAASRPQWVAALLAATAPQLGGLSPHGLQLLLSGLHAVQVEVDAGWAAACARAVTAHVSGPLPAASKVALLQRLCSLEPTSAENAMGRMGGVSRAAAGAARRRELPAQVPLQEESGGGKLPSCMPHGAREGSAVGRGQRRGSWRGCRVLEQQQRRRRQRLWGPVVAAGLWSMCRASDASGPLLKLHLELLKAKVRLKRLLLASAAAGGAGAGAAPTGRRLAAAAAASVADTAAAALGPAAGAAALDVRALTAAASKVRNTVMHAALRRGPSQWQQQPQQRRRGRGILGRMPHIPRAQRVWIWGRARRSTATMLAESSPVLVAKLVVLTSEFWTAGDHQTWPPAAAAAAAPMMPPVAFAGGDGVGAKDTATHVATSGLPVLTELSCRHKSLLWLAGATSSCWRFMLRCHRAQVARAWRRILQRLAAEGPLGHAVGQEVEARLPQQLAAVKRRCHRRANVDAGSTGELDEEGSSGKQGWQGTRGEAAVGSMGLDAEMAAA
ncbi:hypothetical protein Agub_g2017 [Astrephomene gubernaculifera]|uniref:Uncharacterized protein n=1 Tax=Astrephomene gubernaculifera TaxID=47775 RepID=A0AAD3HHS2_9CHLO|nr:hypothetical protein Agub_g2017 [Astrephomene gubernaculifera]